jgi:hypothetical protein
MPVWEKSAKRLVQLLLKYNISKMHGLFGQIYCLNGLKIKDDSANYTRSLRMYNCLHKL